VLPPVSGILYKNELEGGTEKEGKGACKGPRGSVVVREYPQREEGGKRKGHTALSEK
jgi:hypothetical protein